MWDTTLYVFLGASTTALSVWSILVSLRPVAREQDKNLHVVGIIVLASATFMLTVIAGFRNHYSQRDAAKVQSDLSDGLRKSTSGLIQANQTLIESRSAEEFMKGQLSGLSLIVSSLASRGGSENLALAKALKSIADGSTARTPTPPNSPTIADPTATLKQTLSQANPYSEVKQLAVEFFQSDLEMQRVSRTVLQEWALPYKVGAIRLPMPSKLPEDLQQQLKMRDDIAVNNLIGMAARVYGVRNSGVSYLQLTIDQKAKDDVRFNAAFVKGTIRTPAASLELGQIDIYRFQPLSTYFEDLADKLKSLR